MFLKREVLIQTSEPTPRVVLLNGTVCVYRVRVVTILKYLLNTHARSILRNWVAQ